MSLSIIWLSFFIVSFIFILINLLGGNVDMLKTLTDGIFDTAKLSVIDIGLPLAGTMIFFLGLMNVAEKSGIINKISSCVSPLLIRLFPDIPPKSPVMGHMVMNFSANLLGLDNAATPFGLKAMNGLQELNSDKSQASPAQIMFLVLHTSGLTLIPLTIISYRITYNSIDPTAIFIPCVLATLATTLTSIFVISFFQKIIWDKVLIISILSILLGMILFLWIINQLPPDTKSLFSQVSGNLILWSIIIFILSFGLFKKLNIFSLFIDGAKEGLDVIFKIIPYLVAMLVSIRVFRDSGALTFLIDGIIYIIKFTGLNPDFIPSLPVAIMKPISGSGARGMMLDIFKEYGPDSFVGKLASIFQGSADTTFYIIALYFGSVGIKKIKYSLWVGLLADFLGVIIAIFIGYIFFY